MFLLLVSGTQRDTVHLLMCLHGLFCTCYLQYAYCNLRDASYLLLATCSTIFAVAVNFGLKN